MLLKVDPCECSEKKERGIRFGLLDLSMKMINETSLKNNTKEKMLALSHQKNGNMKVKTAKQEVWDGLK